MLDKKEFAKGCLILGQAFNREILPDVYWEFFKDIETIIFTRAVKQIVNNQVEPFVNLIALVKKACVQERLREDVSLGLEEEHKNPASAERVKELVNKVKSF